MTKDYNTVGKKAVHFAAEDNDVDALQYRKNQGDDINLADNNWWRPIHYASASGSSESAKFLLDSEVDFYGRRYMTEAGSCQGSIHLAAYHGHTNIVDLFLNKKPKIIEWEDGYPKCSNWMTPLHWAAKGGHLDTVVSLINKGADVNHNDFFFGEHLYSMLPRKDI